MKAMKTLLVLVCLVAFCPFVSRAATPIDPKFHGKFVGLSQNAIYEGKSFEESLVELSVDADGLSRSVRIGGHKFDVYFSRAWLMNAQEFGEDKPADLKGLDLFAIKQHLNTILPPSRVIRRNTLRRRSNCLKKPWKIIPILMPAPHI